VKSRHCCATSWRSLTAGISLNNVEIALFSLAALLGTTCGSAVVACRRWLQIRYLMCLVIFELFIALGLLGSGALE